MMSCAQRCVRAARSTSYRVVFLVRITMMSCAQRCVWEHNAQHPVYNLRWQIRDSSRHYFIHFVRWAIQYPKFENNAFHQPSKSQHTELLKAPWPWGHGYALSYDLHPARLKKVYLVSLQPKYKYKHKKMQTAVCDFQTFVNFSRKSWCSSLVSFPVEFAGKIQIQAKTNTNIFVDISSKSWCSSLVSLQAVCAQPRAAISGPRFLPTLSPNNAV